MTKYLIWFLIVLQMLWAGFAVAESSTSSTSQPWLSEAEQQLKSWQKDTVAWKENFPSLKQLEERQNEAFQLRQKTESCISDFSGEFDLLQEKLQAIGDESEGEPLEINKRRKALNSEKQIVESELAVCRLLALGLKDLRDEHKLLRSKLLSRELSHRKQPVWETAFSLMLHQNFFSPGFKFEYQFWPALLGGIILLFVLLPASRYLSEFVKKGDFLKGTEHSSLGDSLFVLMLANRLPWSAALISLIVMFYMAGVVLVSAILLSILISLLLAPFLELLFCQQGKLCKKGLPARILLHIVLIGAALYLAGVNEVLSADGFLVLKAVYYLLLMVVSLWLVLLLSSRESFQVLNAIRAPVIIAMIAGPVSLWTGYYALSDILVPGVYGTLIGFLTAWPMFQAGRFLFAMFEPDTPQSSESLRSFLGYQGQELIPGLWIGRLLLFVAVAGGMFYWLLIAWKVPESDINVLTTRFSEGFSVGAVNVVPGKILAAIIAFFILLTFARWLKNQLSDRWLQKTRLDVGARESIVSLTTYVIVGLALVMALGMAGVDFQNVAIVAGALSVGIGFGLQNIVNNFVSGLILLFERPVKPGDWVVVGTTEGHVKKISIRYTLIQTFDRADVLVPNSELISSQVTNWMLKDSLGRVIVPVGVAYGSDTQRVKDILYKVAADHPLVLVNDWRVPEPKVVFMNFGDSSLNFEVRCFIKDVNQRLAVRSDLLFAIDASFREENIEIPFPQRVIHKADKVPDDAPGSTE